ncbi:DUF2892 domain-containing protein [Halorussus salilacus]|uniref:DUF2892 domain-containing protein n=1 Tax=Halorussus salilacus TaxID=2953750 RepID=UPI00209EA1CE|nr:DUF2892 domain-containing protein [Halorussus salilacus]USZ69401.1 DUF2892 domain-containing protein [Halorussus salilacus]
MDPNEGTDDPDRLARILLATALAVVAAVWLRSGKRVRGALAGVGALAVGYGLATESGDLMETIDIEGSEERAGLSEEDGGLRCAACGEPIVPGQRRGPNENHEIVHEDCE